MIEAAAGPNIGDDDDDETFEQFFAASPPAIFDGARDALAPYGVDLVERRSSDNNNDSNEDDDDDDNDDDNDPAELSSQDAQSL